jgi:hypothetical protein
MTCDPSKIRIPNAGDVECARNFLGNCCWWARMWSLAKLEPQPEPRSLGLIKEAIHKRYSSAAQRR